MSRLLLPVAVVLLVCLAEVGLTGLLMKSNGKQHVGAGWTLTREFLYGRRWAAPKLDHSDRQHIASLGIGRRRGCRAGRQEAK